MNILFDWQNNDYYCPMVAGMTRQMLIVPNSPSCILCQQKLPVLNALIQVANRASIVKIVVMAFGIKSCASRHRNHDKLSHLMLTLFLAGGKFHKSCAQNLSEKAAFMDLWVVYQSLLCRVPRLKSLCALTIRSNINASNIYTGVTTISNLPKRLRDIILLIDILGDEYLDPQRSNGKSYIEEHV